VVTTSLLRDNLHVAVSHNHTADVAAVEALKVKTTMHDRVRDVRVLSGQVLATGVVSASQEVWVKIGRIDEIYYKQVVGLRLQNIRDGGECRIPWGEYVRGDYVRG